VAATGENGSDRILFQMGRERGQRAFSIWTIDVGSGGALNATEICNSPTTALINPTWSPDGRWIAYAEVPIPDAPSSAAVATTNAVRPSWSTLWMVSVEGEGRVRLTTGPGVPLSPTWGANNRLYFVWNRSGTDNVWSLDISPAVAAAQATVGGGPVVAHAAPTNAPKNDTVANVPENDSASHVAPR
jgi:Tol biopolymer transport system component